MKLFVRDVVKYFLIARKFQPHKHITNVFSPIFWNGKNIIWSTSHITMEFYCLKQRTQNGLVPTATAQHVYRFSPQFVSQKVFIFGSNNQCLVCQQVLPSCQSRRKTSLNESLEKISSIEKRHYRPEWFTDLTRRFSVRPIYFDLVRPDFFSVNSNFAFWALHTPPVTLLADFATCLPFCPDRAVTPPTV